MLVPQIDLEEAQGPNRLNAVAIWSWPRGPFCWAAACLAWAALPLLLAAWAFGRSALLGRSRASLLGRRAYAGLAGRARLRAKLGRSACFGL